MAPRRSLGYDAQERSYPEPGDYRPGDPVDPSQPADGEPGAQQAHTPAQQQPPQRRSREHARDQHHRREVPFARLDQAQSGEDRHEGEYRRGIGDGQTERRSVRPRETPSTAPACGGFTFGWLLEESLYAQVKKEHPTHQAQPELLFD